MRVWKHLSLLVLVIALASCGGSNSSSSSSSSSSSQISVAGASVTAPEASRFLTQASFGATQTSIDEVVGSNVETWIERQLLLPNASHLSYVDNLAAGGVTLHEKNFFESFWTQAISGNDQLRQRVSFALSQILVTSFDGVLSDNTRAIASYYDVLNRNAFGNFRTLLEEVSLHPAMGQYLSHIKNQKEDVAKGRMPDENYAREIMQLFTIGLYELNLDGTNKLNAGKPIETYTNTDITGLAKVFTGWSYGGADKSDNRFYGWISDTQRDTVPMQNYPKFHSSSAKTFLGTTIPTNTNGVDSLRIALDTLFNHPNTPPFITKQLIQRLVTSNPSAGYVQRVAAVFKDNGQGVRGDMKAVIRAILLDTEARNISTSQGVAYGKVREPVIRLANWARAFGAQTTSGRYAIDNTDTASTALGQTPMRSNSVFNFYRPGYVPPGTQIAHNGLTAPEMQTTNETSVAGYINYMQGVIQNGPYPSTGNATDRVVSTYDALIPLADTSSALVDKVSLLLSTTLKSSTRTLIMGAVDGITISSTNPTSAANARKNRVYLAIMLVMACPEYLIQK